MNIQSFIQVNRQTVSSSSMREYWGVASEKIDLSHIPFDKYVLDIGSGSGEIAKRIRDERRCVVKAIEPGLELSNSNEKDPFVASCNLLGKENVEKLTLQDAIQNERYQNKFDVVTVHKYNVAIRDKESFIAGLKKTIKPDGIVIVHSVESERVFRTQFKKDIYLIDELKKHFNEVRVTKRKYGVTDECRDAIVHCQNPKHI